MKEDELLVCVLEYAGDKLFLIGRGGEWIPKTSHNRQINTSIEIWGGKLYMEVFCREVLDSELCRLWFWIDYLYVHFYILLFNYFVLVQEKREFEISLTIDKSIQALIR